MIKKALLKKNRDLDAEAVQAFKSMAELSLFPSPDLPSIVSHDIYHRGLCSDVMSYMGDRATSKKETEHAR